MEISLEPKHVDEHRVVGAAVEEQGGAVHRELARIIRSAVGVDTKSTINRKYQYIYTYNGKLDNSYIQYISNKRICRTYK